MRSSALACVVLALALAATTARADEADRHFAAGVRFFARGAHHEALAEFERSRAARETARVVFNVAACRVALSQWSEAAADFARFVELRGDRLSADERQELQRFRAELAPHLAELTVVTTPADADVRIEDRPVRTFPVIVDVGRLIRIEARGPGLVPARERVTPRAAGPLEVRLVLEAAASRGSPRPADAAPSRVDETPRVEVSAPTRPAPVIRSRSSALPWILLAGGAVLAGGVVTAFALGGEQPLQGDFEVHLP